MEKRSNKQKQMIYQLAAGPPTDIERTCPNKRTPTNASRIKCESALNACPPAAHRPAHQQKHIRPTNQTNQTPTDSSIHSCIHSFICTGCNSSAHPNASDPAKQNLPPRLSQIASTQWINWWIHRRPCWRTHWSNIANAHALNHPTAHWVNKPNATQQKHTHPDPTAHDTNHFIVACTKRLTTTTRRRHAQQQERDTNQSNHTLGN